MARLDINAKDYYGHYPVKLNKFIRNAYSKQPTTHFNDKTVCSLLFNGYYEKKENAMRIEKITDDKKQYLDLLLLADEQEDMIDRYLENGNMFALYDDDLKTVCVVAAIDKETCELKNIATYEKDQGKGYGRALINYVSDYYKNNYKTILVGTGETPTILSFYQSCGFEKSHRLKNFFTDNYDHPIFEEGIQLVDMIYLKKEL